MAGTYIEIEQEDGKYVKFKKEKVKARWLKEVFKMEKEVNELGKKGEYAEAMDVRVKFIVSLFDNPELTEDVIYDGIDSDKIVKEFERINDDITGKPKPKGKGNDAGK